MSASPSKQVRSAPATLSTCKLPPGPGGCHAPHLLPEPLSAGLPASLQSVFQSAAPASLWKHTSDQGIYSSSPFWFLTQRHLNSDFFPDQHICIFLSPLDTLSPYLFKSQTPLFTGCVLVKCVCVYCLFQLHGYKLPGDETLCCSLLFPKPRRMITLILICGNSSPL